VDIADDGSIRLVTAGFEEDTAGSPLPDLSGELKKIPTVGDYLGGAYDVVKFLWAANQNDAIGIFTAFFDRNSNFGIGGHDQCSEPNRAAGDLGDIQETGCDYRLRYFISEVGTANYGGNPVLIQSKFGGRGNFELIVPRSDTGIDFLFRNNDNHYLPWFGPFAGFQDRGHFDSVTMIQSNFGTPGAFEGVARMGDRLAFFWRESGPPFAWHGHAIEGSEGSSGNPVMIQSRIGERGGNFELVVPRVDGGFNFFFRDNDAAGTPWRGPFPVAVDSGHIDALSLIQSNFGNNLEMIARYGDRLAFLWRDDNLEWHGPFFMSGSEGSSGNPVMIQSRFGERGNFELVVPRVDGGFNFYFRENDVEGLPWRGPFPVAVDSGHIDEMSLIQSNYGDFLEIVARYGNNLGFIWRDGPPNFIWHGPFFLPN
jgi:hypothetical protein